MLSGAYPYTLDQKNRLIVPKPIQDLLRRDNGDGTPIAYLTAGPDRCLYLFSERSFERAQKELETRVFAGQAQRAVLRIFFANTARVELDASGRLLVPEKLKAHAGIDRDVVIIGVKDRAEIWASETWQSYEASNESLLEQIDEVMRTPPPAAGNA